AAHGGSRAALTARWRRVARIATHPARRREGLGRALIEADILDARARGIALYGATFGAEAALLEFWLALGFLPVRLGVTREPSTGEYAVMVARALDDEGERVLAALRGAFAASLLGLLAFELAALPAGVVLRLLGTLPLREPGAQERQDIIDVAYAHRDPALARAALAALARRASALAVKKALAPEVIGHLETLAGWAFQNRAPHQAPREANRALRQAARAVAEATLSPFEPER
ncbi:tRNA(Met) cytidine acetyltransferase, partial [Halomonas sp. 707D4]|nr:tRNA(Met) cytidine acetyltransferase [Halomonas sp. 707D4]